MSEPMWKIVTAAEGQEWPCTIVDSEGRSLLGVHNGTPVIRSRELAEQILATLTTTPAETGGGQ